MRVLLKVTVREGQQRGNVAVGNLFRTHQNLADGGTDAALKRSAPSHTFLELDDCPCQKINVGSEIIGLVESGSSLAVQRLPMPVFSLNFRRRFRDLGGSLLRIRFQFLAAASTNDTRNFGTWQLPASPPLRFVCHVLQQLQRENLIFQPRLLRCSHPTASLVHRTDLSLLRRTNTARRRANWTTVTLAKPMRKLCLTNDFNGRVGNTCVSTCISCTRKSK